ncbi:MAG: polyprenyl synthetase family protein, partial [Ilumatobacteraceae bacterium]
DVGEVISRLSAYGLPLGDAFQMRDDVMGAFGDTSMTGKPVGGDLREGKPTPLLARAIASATTAQAKILEMVGSIDLSDEQVADIQQTIVDVGALDELESLIASNVASAIQAIESPAIAEAAQQPLIELAEFITNRSS